MAGIKINGDTNGSTTITAPDTGTDETIELSTALASKLDLAGGKILQIVRATDSTTRTTTSSSYVDASISVAITPQKSDSAVILLWSLMPKKATSYTSLQIADSSNNAISGAQNARAGTSIGNSTTVIAYATPATTSAVTYKGRFAAAGGGTAEINNGSQTGQLYALEVSA